jgi:hypothetical protein
MASSQTTSTTYTGSVTAARSIYQSTTTPLPSIDENSIEYRRQLELVPEEDRKDVRLICRFVDQLPTTVYTIYLEYQKDLIDTIYRLNRRLD